MAEIKYPSTCVPHKLANNGDEGYEKDEIHTNPVNPGSLHQKSQLGHIPIPLESR